ncbi:UDP-N-acetylmuramoyl-L-alanyl-D-glutamate--2,6-diaminopimelate ligase [uncultured Corynebacterium sp.]|uniref:UDP-N-acetylmuramoyl-L-alanyl-D-glutamate--2, 6-diaminopimelate ligase n=1 Tax=uncultured Corynebacterium sp. TaxID=159447 RepID=UPI0025E8E3BA|nr:UDP-N-acetylmuramoyl-L-alanyl-D-glutamate--2,6-diaminopimelate ligase [uncultured Corynebacterium sp.]
MTTLQTLAELTGGRVSRTDAHVEVTSAAIGSSDVVEGGLFCAVPGLKAHGARYAAGSKATAVLTDAAGDDILRDQGSDLPRIIVDDVREWMGPVAAEIYGHPSSKLAVIGITGTSGKTTTSYLVEKALLPKHSVGIIGTTGTRINGRPIPTQLTTPEAPTMQSLLAKMVAEGVTHVVMEVSSHALELGRVRGIEFDVAAFTNLSQDHLDFHPTMEDYFQAKAKLFTTAAVASADGSPTVPAAVICVDDEWGQRMAQIAQQREEHTNGAVAPVLAVRSNKQPADENSSASLPTWQLDDVTVTPTGRQEIRFNTGAAEDLEYSIGLAGSFNVANSAVALACVAQLAEDVATAAQHLRDVQVPGRMQAVDEGQDFLAMVDYAHKPGAVAAVVRTLADYLPNEDGRIGIVIGAGGNRDQDKRPKMGYEAALIANAIFVTDDNPRDEDPEPIRAAIVSGAEEGFAERGVEKNEVTLANIADRAEAIAAATRWAQPGDAIVVAGKGHETGQLVAGVMHDFDDVEQLRVAVQRVIAERNKQTNSGDQGGM